MSWIWIITSSLSAILMAWSLLILNRNDRVLAYRHNLIERIGGANVSDIRAGKYDVEWRWDIYHSVSYNEMLYKVWRPLDSFYPDLSFLEPKTGART